MRTARLAFLTAAALAAVHLAAGRPEAAVPLCVAALLGVGELLTRALPGIPVERGVPAARIGTAAMAGLVTLPLVALLLHACGFPVRSTPLVLGESVVTVLATAAALLRERRGHPVGLPAQRSAPTADSSPAADAAAPPAAGAAGRLVAVGVPVLLALGIGGVATRAYEDAPQPAEPGYLSVALGGWAAGIEAPVTVPVKGLAVPVRVTSAGLGDVTTMVRLRIGGRIVAAKRVTVAAGTVRSFTVRVTAVPQDGCLHPVNISVGKMSAGFYARGAAKVLTRTAGFRGSATRC